MGYKNRICECTQIQCQVGNYHARRKKSGATKNGCTNAPKVIAHSPDGGRGYVVCPPCAKTHEAQGWVIVTK